MSAPAPGWALLRHNLARAGMAVFWTVAIVVVLANLLLLAVLPFANWSSVGGCP